MSLKKYKFSYQDILDIADEVSGNETINKLGLTLEYNLDPANHKAINEELFYKTNASEEEGELVYHKVIELLVNGVNFKLISE